MAYLHEISAIYNTYMKTRYSLIAPHMHILLVYILWVDWLMFLGTKLQNLNNTVILECVDCPSEA